MKEYYLLINKPQIITHPDHAFFQSIFSVNSCYQNWLYTNFIQLYCNFPKSKISKAIDLDFLCQYEYSNFVDIQLIYRNIYEYENRNISCIDYFCDLLERNLYLIIAVDEMYLSFSHSYNRYHFKHPLFLYGFNKEKGVFNASYYSSKGYVAEGLVKFSEVEYAFSGFISMLGVNNGLLIRAISSVEAKYEVNVEVIQKGVEEYIYPPSVSLDMAFVGKSMTGKVFGLNIYEALLTYNKLIADGINQEFIPSYKNYHALYEHKVIMLHRINYLKEIGVLSSISIKQYSEIVDKALAIRNLYIKCLLTKNLDSLQSVNCQLILLREKEKKNMEFLLRELQ